MGTYDHSGILYYIETQYVDSAERIELFSWEDIILIAEHCKQYHPNEVVIVKEFDIE